MKSFINIVDKFSREFVPMNFENLIQKFYPNANVRIAELYPCYDSAQSFYGKARVVEIEDDVFLISYDTIVAFFNRNVRTVGVIDTYSATTLRHIKEFLRQNGFKAETKKQIENDYIKEVA